MSASKNDFPFTELQLLVGISSAFFACGDGDENSKGNGNVDSFLRKRREACDAYTVESLPSMK